MRIIISLALAIALATSVAPASAQQGWIARAIQSQKPQCPPKKPKADVPASSFKKPASK